MRSSPKTQNFCLSYENCHANILLFDPFWATFYFILFHFFLHQRANPPCSTLETLLPWWQPQCIAHSRVSGRAAFKRRSLTLYLAGRLWWKRLCWRRTNITKKGAEQETRAGVSEEPELFETRELFRSVKEAVFLFVWGVLNVGIQLLLPSSEQRHKYMQFM